MINHISANRREGFGELDDMIVDIQENTLAPVTATLHH